MRISKVDVRGLFGLFSYTIPLKLEDRITIIHGPNGCGMTTVLRMVHDVFAKRLGEVSRTRFDELLITFDDSQQLKIAKIPAAVTPAQPGKRRSAQQKPQLEFSLTEGSQQKPWTWTGGKGAGNEIADCLFPDSGRIGADFAGIL